MCKPRLCRYVGRFVFFCAKKNVEEHECRDFVQNFIVTYDLKEHPAKNMEALSTMEVEGQVLKKKHKGIIEE